MSTVLFKRGSSADMADTPITDGMLFFNEEDFKIYMDNGSERVQYGGDTELISDPSEALLTNAFNARGSLDVFLQKTSVIDSKNNALTITQNYVPLGCLAFKEALGTSSYAGIGDGTISGGLVNLNTRVNTAQSGVTNLQAQLRASGTNFYFDYKNGRYGWNSSSARGAGTFHPFRQAVSIPTISVYGAGGGNGTYAAQMIQSLDSATTLTVDSWSTNNEQYGKQPAYIDLSSDGGSNWSRLWTYPQDYAQKPVGTFNVSGYTHVKFYVSTFGNGVISQFNNITIS